MGSSLLDARVPSRSCSDSDSTYTASSPSALASLNSSSPSPPSLYVTFRVLSIVNAFRKRIAKIAAAKNTKTRKVKIHSRTRKDYCSELERQAYDEVDRYLGRKTGWSDRKSVLTERRRKTKACDDPVESNTFRKRYVVALCHPAWRYFRNRKAR
jgi:hypothetical protein